jgi:chorismate mutase / prephenate dehydratase
MRPNDPEQDPVVRDLRGRISAQDRAVLAAVNERIGLVAELREHKRAQGWDFLDSDREERLLAALAAENRGPLSEEGLRELFTDLLALTKRELDA